MIEHNRPKRKNNFIKELSKIAKYYTSKNLFM